MNTERSSRPFTPPWAATAWNCRDVDTVQQCSYGWLFISGVFYAILALSTCFVRRRSEAIIISYFDGRNLQRAIKALRRSPPSVFGVDHPDVFSAQEWDPAREAMGQATRRVLPTDQVLETFGIPHTSSSYVWGESVDRADWRHAMLCLCISSFHREIYTCIRRYGIARKSMWSAVVRHAWGRKHHCTLGKSKWRVRR